MKWWTKNQQTNRQINIRILKNVIILVVANVWNGVFELIQSLFVCVCVCCNPMIKYHYYQMIVVVCSAIWNFMHQLKWDFMIYNVLKRIISYLDLNAENSFAIR